jgi:hypothetical protein
METRYIVCDSEGNVSFNDKKREPESFTKFRGPNGAESRAAELALEAPGFVIRIYELTAETIAPVKSVETSRKHPAEHYK